MRSRGRDAAPCPRPGRRLARALLLVAALAVATALPGAGAPAAWAVEDPCLECHGLYGLGVAGRPLWLHRDAFGASLHGRLACADCHKGVGDYPHRPVRIRCDLLCHVPGASHEPVAAAVAQGPHGKLGESACLECHRADESTRPAGVESLCRSCHEGLEPERQRFPDTPGAFGFWGHRGVNPSRRLPSCQDCHGVHDVAAGEAARGRCGTAACHPGAGEDFGELFDHRGDPARPPWGGAGALVLAMGGVMGAILLAHSLRGAS